MERTRNPLLAGSERTARRDSQRALRDGRLQPFSVCPTRRPAIRAVSSSSVAAHGQKKTPPASNRRCARGLAKSHCGRRASLTNEGEGTHLGVTTSQWREAIQNPKTRVAPLSFKLALSISLRVNDAPILISIPELSSQFVLFCQFSAGTILQLQVSQTKGQAFRFIKKE